MIWRIFWKNKKNKTHEKKKSKIKNPRSTQIFFKNFLSLTVDFFVSQKKIITSSIKRTKKRHHKGCQQHFWELFICVSQSTPQGFRQSQQTWFHPPFRHKPSSPSCKFFHSFLLLLFNKKWAGKFKLKSPNFPNPHVLQTLSACCHWCAYSNLLYCHAT